MGTSGNSNGFGVYFRKLAGASSTQRTATIVNEDEYVRFNVDDEVVFDQFYYLEDDGVGADLIEIALFKNEEDKIGLARWPYGINDGKIMFFSDFDADYLSGDFQEILEGSAKKWANARCLPINISNMKVDNLVTINRLLIYDSEPLRMVLYVWQ